MPPPTVCPECRTRLRFGADTRGQMIDCPECEARLLVSVDGRIERAASGSPDAGRESSTILWRLVVAVGLLLVAFGVGWSFGTNRQSGPHADDTQAMPPPIQPENAPKQPLQQAAPFPHVKQEQPPADIRLASATERPLQRDGEPPKSELADATPKAATVDAPASPQKAEPAPRQAPPDPDVQPLPPQKVVPPPPVPRGEELPAQPPVARSVVPIETLARQKLQRFEVSKPTPLKEVLRDLSELLAGRLELAETVPSQELDQRVAVALTDADVMAVIEAALRSTALRAAVQGDRIVISPK